MDIQRIKFERSGGFAPVRFAADFELADLPDDQARQLGELFDDLDFGELPEQLGENQIADGFTYVVTVISETRSHTVTASDSSAPEKMHSLLNLLTQIARQQMKKQ